MLAPVRKRIVDGWASPGSRLEVDVMAAGPRVSRIPVREAHTTLLGQGLAAHRPRAGFRVSPPFPGKLGQPFAVRATLEHAAVSVAFLRRRSADVDGVHSAHAAFLAAVDVGDGRGPPLLTRLRCGAHRPFGLAPVAGGVARIWDLTEPYRPMDGLGPAEAHDVHEQHTGMLEALAAGDVGRLLATAAAHQQDLSSRVRVREWSPSPGPVHRTRRRTTGVVGAEE